CLPETGAIREAEKRAGIGSHCSVGALNCMTWKARLGPPWKCQRQDRCLHRSCAERNRPGSPVELRKKESGPPRQSMVRESAQGITSGNRLKARSGQKRDGARPMRIERRNTTQGQSPYAGIDFRLTTSEIRN